MFCISWFIILRTIRGISIPTFCANGICFICNLYFKLGVEYCENKLLTLICCLLLYLYVDNWEICKMFFTWSVSVVLSSMSGWGWWKVSPSLISVVNVINLLPFWSNVLESVSLAWNELARGTLSSLLLMGHFKGKKFCNIGSWIVFWGLACVLLSFEAEGV